MIKINKKLHNVIEITVINENSFPSEFLQDLKKLHLYENKFHCNCSIHWFRHWMKDNYGKLDALDYEKKFILPNNNQNMSCLKHCHFLELEFLIVFTLAIFI
jgi:hypothetical protein